MRVRVYVDGFNLYYRGLRGTNFKWLNLATLASELLDPNDTLEAIRYFTADVSPKSGDPDAPTRQQAYYRALRTIDNLTIHRGNFLPKTKTRPLLGQEKSFVIIHDTEEKGSDVNLASYLLMDGFKDLYDAALVVSQDTDLLEPMRMVKEELGKTVGLIWIDEKTKPGKKHKRVTDFVRYANRSILKKSQFSNPLFGSGGEKIEKPTSW